jgi:hypothetical protein
LAIRLEPTQETLDDALNSIGKGTGKGGGKKNGKGNSETARFLQECQQDLTKGEKQLTELDNEINSQNRNLKAAK